MKPVRFSPIPRFDGLPAGNIPGFYEVWDVESAHYIGNVAKCGDGQWRASNIRGDALGPFRTRREAGMALSEWEWGSEAQP